MSGFTSFIGRFREGPAGQAVTVSSFVEFTETFGGIDEASEASYQVSQFFLNGGTRASIVRVDSVDGAVANLEALDEAADLLCIPGLEDPEAIAAVAKWCENHECFHLMDAPAGLSSPSAVTAWFDANRTLLSSDFAALAWPRIRIDDPQQDNLPRTVGACGTVAGLYAANDAARGVWDAPAGLHAPVNCAGLEYTMNDQENALLTVRGINAIRRFPTHGIVLWGARTLNALTSYVATRRTVIYIEQSLEASLQWTVFEPNNEALWQRVTVQVEQFLDGLWKEGGLMGMKAGDAYFVRCDATTTTQAEIEQGKLICMAGVALTRPAEFTMIQIECAAATPA